MSEPGPTPNNAAPDAAGVDAEQRADRRAESADKQPENTPQPESPRPREIGGRKGPEPTRYGDWELKGRCIDF